MTNQVKLFITYKVLCPYHNFFMTIARLIKSKRVYSYHRELYEQADFAYGRYKFLQNK